MGKMLENIAHQWRQPLSTLSVISSNIKDKIIFKGAEKDIFELLDRNKTIIKKMSETIDDFRHFFKTKNKKYYGYKNQLAQILINIINNAIDSLKESRKKEKLIEIIVENKNNNLVIQIQNNDEKIKDNIIKNIFDPYFSTKDSKNGTGLGLYMSKVIITNHFGGEINVFSTKNLTTFELILEKSFKLEV